ncbi:hypothetical protein [Microvirga arsenatis]|uniref:Uncharacterized protein n=1 Tax=Microvirga arsenatis TaxID=2692265 RepID=A0ABW9YWM7_9HYPH|nr:hypothetical protein [Microvirga arsenatis]NBJ13302.1 hypothetical protein [Microvirga arsenatis]NBJ24086.1 hypothetical protein [Microvirga arsenatis]
MNQPIRIWHISAFPDAEHTAFLQAIHGEETMARVDAHNARVLSAWFAHGPACKPFTPSAVPADLADLSRVPAAEHGGSLSEEACA